MNTEKMNQKEELGALKTIIHRLKEEGLIDRDMPTEKLEESTEEIIYEKVFEKLLSIIRDQAAHVLALEDEKQALKEAQGITDLYNENEDLKDQVQMLNEVICHMMLENNLLQQENAALKPASLKTHKKSNGKRAAAKKDEFVPHLIFEITGGFCGKIGTPTKMKDTGGKPLFIGDIVEIMEKGSDMRVHTYIIEDEGKSLVMGIEEDCSADGTISDNWVVIKRKGYKELENGETHSFIKAILEE